MDPARPAFCCTFFEGSLPFVLVVDVSNRALKKQLIDLYGDKICFCYPNDKTKSQLVFSRTIESSSLVETIRSHDAVEICAGILRDECKQYDFNLDNSFKSAEDLVSSYNSFKGQRPPSWEKFFDVMFPYRKKSDVIQRKCDTVFQIAFSIVHNLTKVPPLHVFVAQAIHDVSRSKKLINIMNRLGISISYHEMLQIDTLLATKLIQNAGPHRVPVAEEIKSATTISGAMDNFDHEENTLSGIGGSHDTVLVLFQNSMEENNRPGYIRMLPESLKQSGKVRSLDHVLPCQLLYKAKHYGKRGEIPAAFTTTGNFTDNFKTSSRNQFKVWSAARSDLFAKAENNVIPSFAATNSLFSSPVKAITSFAFTPIVPYPATEFDTIFTCMKNFQDVLQQRDLEYGPLWCDEGVYCIAKELQLLNPDTFSNIFLGLGGFHMEKIVIACCGTYLANTGIENILVEHEIFGPGVVKSVMSGSNYIRGKRGMILVAEALTRLQLETFSSESHNTLKDEKVKENMIALQNLCNNHDPKENYSWKQYQDPMEEFLKVFDDFVKNRCLISKSFQFWNTFLNDVVPILIDLTRSHREGNWDLHLSAVRRSLPLFFPLTEHITADGVHCILKIVWH